MRAHKPLNTNSFYQSPQSLSAPLCSRLNFRFSPTHTHYRYTKQSKKQPSNSLESKISLKNNRVFPFLRIKNKTISKKTSSQPTPQVAVGDLIDYTTLKKNHSQTQSYHSEQSFRTNNRKNAHTRIGQCCCCSFPQILTYCVCERELSFYSLSLNFITPPQTLTFQNTHTHTHDFFLFYHFSYF